MWAKERCGGAASARLQRHLDAGELLPRDAQLRLQGEISRRGPPRMSCLTLFSPLQHRHMRLKTRCLHIKHTSHLQVRRVLLPSGGGAAAATPLLRRHLRLLVLLQQLQPVARQLSLCVLRAGHRLRQQLRPLRLRQLCAQRGVDQPGIAEDTVSDCATVGGADSSRSEVATKAHMPNLLRGYSVARLRPLL